MERFRSRLTTTMRSSKPNPFPFFQQTR
ncbi:MAG: hypothetical protein J07HX5_00958, partial [halophilic archaeon J07HX5]